MEEETKDEVIEELQEKIVGKGIGRALEVFRERGMLGKTMSFGRNKDKSVD